MKVTSLRHWAGFALALLFLNFALTFENVWPTPAVRWEGELSIELAVLLTWLAFSNARGGPTSPRVLRVLAGLFVVFALGRYGEVTAPALYGRPVNLYWDLPNVGSVVAMVSRAAPTWIVVGATVALILVLTFMYAAARWALGRIDESLRSRRARQAVSTVAASCTTLFIAQALIKQLPQVPQFSTPVTQTYAIQLSRVYDTFAMSPAARRIPASPQFHSDLGALANRDVLLVFMESYGRVTYDRPSIAREVTAAREQLEEAARRTGRSVVSAFVTSPTFGGNSWFAHSSLLSGVDVTDPDRYALLLTQKRPTLSSFFAQHGYRVVADMPGVRQGWPEGAFYGFDTMYDADALDYRGPEFGWWRIPDQFSLAAVDAREIQPQRRKPLFMLFPTLNTHMPWRPTPPFQLDWARVLGPQPYDSAAVQQSLTETPAWTDMGSSYAQSFVYSFRMFSDYLLERADHDFVLILIGDHQPAANVSGAGASWDVPVHVITRVPQIAEALKRSGFVDGMTPAPHPIGRMNELSQTLLSTFSSPATTGSSRATTGSSPATTGAAPWIPSHLGNAGT